MASTYKLINAFADIKEKLRKMPLEQQLAYIMQDALNDFWMAAPWRWTLGAMPTTTITNGQSDQTVAVPTDYVYLFNAFYTDAGGSFVQPLHVEPTIPSGTQIQGVPNKIAVVGGNAFRLNPVPSGLPSGDVIVSLYKKAVPILTPINMRAAGTQVFDDEYWTVFKAILLYYSYQWGDDQRAGSVQMQASQIAYTGQLGVAKAMVEQMKMQEPLPTMYIQKGSEEAKT